MSITPIFWLIKGRGVLDQQHCRRNQSASNPIHTHTYIQTHTHTHINTHTHTQDKCQIFRNIFTFA